MRKYDTFADEIIYGTKAGVEDYILNGEDLGQIDEYGYNPIVEAAVMDKYDIAEMLLKYGTNVDERDMTGRTALHWAVDNNSYAMSKLLLDRKADPNAYTRGCQPVLSIALLRNKENIKDLLYQYGADLNFAQDYINAKLIGHRYEIQGKVHIVDTYKNFILLDFEGFFLEATVSIVRDSLKRFRGNFAARHLMQYSHYITQALKALEFAEELISYQVFTINTEDYVQRIYKLLGNDLLLMPIAYEGHAITCIKCGDLWLKCDRGYNAQVEGSVVVYRVTKPELVTKSFLKDLIYKKHSREFVNQGINEYLGMVKLAELPLPPQVTGNCSWANVEASVPAMLFLLLLHDEHRITAVEIEKYSEIAMDFFYQWREWDKDRAIEECIQSFHHASPERQASKAALLAAVLVERCRYDVTHELKRAEKIFPILAIPQFHYILKSYLKVYVENRRTDIGENLKHLFDLVGPKGLPEILMG